MCAQEVIRGWLQDHKPLILCGPPGSGKSMTLMSTLKAMTEFDVACLNFSSATSPDLIVTTLDQHCDIRQTTAGPVRKPVDRAGVFAFQPGFLMIMIAVVQSIGYPHCLSPSSFLSHSSSSPLSPSPSFWLAGSLYLLFTHACDVQVMTPRGGKWLVIFCDEINLPSEDKYGTQRVISFMRHVVELVRALCASVCAYVLCVCSCACVRVFEGATWDRSCVLATDFIMYLLFHGLSPFLFTCFPTAHLFRSRIIAHRLPLQGGFWRSKGGSKVWYSVDRVQFVGACNPPTDPGRVPLSHRFLRHAPVLLVDFPVIPSLYQIYGSFNRALLKLQVCACSGGVWAPARVSVSLCALHLEAFLCAFVVCLLAYHSASHTHTHSHSRHFEASLILSQPPWWSSTP